MVASTPPGEGVSSLPPTLCTRSRISTPGCGKAPRGLLAPSGVPGLCTWLRVHRVPGRDSGDLVDPFMHAGTYPARHLATLRESELLPAFSGASPGWTRGSRTASGQDSAPVHTLSGSRGPVFLLNSRVPLVTATCGPRGKPQDHRHPFSRSYGANLPSSLARVTPICLGLLTQGHLCRFSVRSRGLLPSSLFTGPRSRGNPPNGGPVPSSPGSRHDGTPRASTVGWGMPPLPLSRGVRSWACVAASVPPRRRNINRLPFRWVRVTPHLRTG